jgi:hypothetical protein
LPLTLTEEQYKQLDDLKRQRHSIVCEVNNEDNSLKVHVQGRDVFYEKTIFELQSALNQIRALKEDSKPRKDQHSSLATPSGSAIDRSPILKSEPDLVLQVANAPASKLEFQGKRVNIKTLMDIGIQKTGEPLSDAFARVLEMLIMSISAYKDYKDQNKIRELRVAIKNELQEIQKLDQENNTTHYETAIQVLPESLRAYILAENSASNKVKTIKAEFYAQDDIEERLDKGKPIVVESDPKGLTIDAIQALLMKKGAYDILNPRPEVSFKHNPTQKPGLSDEAVSDPSKNLGGDNEMTTTGTAPRPSPRASH